MYSCNWFLMFTLNILWRVVCVGCLWISLMNIFPTTIFTFLLHGGLNHLVLCFMLFVYLGGGGEWLIVGSAWLLVGGWKMCMCVCVYLWSFLSLHFLYSWYVTFLRLNMTSTKSTSSRFVLVKSHFLENLHHYFSGFVCTVS